MGNLDLEHARLIAHSAAHKASTLLLENYRHDINVEEKGRADYVTSLDHECEEIIKTELATLDDTIAFIGEESTEFSLNGDEVVIDLPETCWIVDPLDATSNYAHGFAGYAVSIGLRVNGELVAAVVDAPSLRETYDAVAGKGTYATYGESERIPVHAKDGGDLFTLVGTAAPFRAQTYLDEYKKLERMLYSEFEDVRRVGSAALDCSWVANGTWGVYVEKFLKPWDCAAGGLLVREAGGIITDWRGDDDQWLINGHILACASERLHEKMLKLISDVS